MSGWSPEGPPVESGGALWSSGDGPPTIAWGSFWSNVPVLVGVEDIFAQDLASAKVIIRAPSEVVVTDIAMIKAILRAPEDVVVADSASVMGRGVSSRDEVIANELAKLGLSQSEEVVAEVAGKLSKLSLQVSDDAIAESLISLNKLVFVGNEAAISEDIATAGFKGPGGDGTTLTTYSTVVSNATHTFRNWSRYVDIIACGGGGGGQGAGWVIGGRGGGGGQLGWARITRGSGWAEVPPTIRTTSITVADGGSGGSGGAFPSHGAAGGNSFAVTSGTNTVFGFGGVSSADSSNPDGSRTGLGANGGNAGVGGNIVDFNGYQYVGAANKNGTPAATPGGGGYGGGAPSGNGARGGAGCVWIREFVG
ncbi:hypothetical protein SEA_RUMI_32 [Gordonia phage Rumi]|nr:hypothetical protein SEA_RUMI_32 [Gordonia phage Rumi]